MSKYVIALIVAYGGDGGYHVLEVYGPLDSKEKADRLAGQMNDRIKELNKALTKETGYEVVVGIWNLERGKAKDAVKKTQALFDELMGENQLDSDRIVVVPREEIVHSPLLNDPMDA